MPVIGYSDRLSVRPGEKIRFMVSCDFRSYRAEIFRMIHADRNAAGPGFKVELIKSSVSGNYRGKKERYPKGSYVLVPRCDGIRNARGLTFQAWIMPTTPTKKELQGIVTLWSRRVGIGIFVDERGGLAMGLKDRLGRTEWVRTRKPMLPSTWYFVAGGVDEATGQVTLMQEPMVAWTLQDRVRATKKLKSPDLRRMRRRVIIGAYGTGTGKRREGKEEEMVTGCFNGKIDRPRIFARYLDTDEMESLKNGASPDAPGLQLAADWDFSHSIWSQEVVDRSPFKSDGTAVNSPKRAVTGYNWTGNEVDFKRALREYGAIHFHDDDLDDSGWSTDIEFQVPQGIRSGIYALRLKARGREDYVPFFVLPGQKRPTADIAFLVPTLTYLAYANDHFIMSDPELKRIILPKGFKGPVTNIDRYLEHTGLLSLYDKHMDGSGVCYASRLRPLLTMRPDYLEAYQSEGRGSPHLFPADLWITDWMEAKGFKYDVITDDDLHHEGLGLISPYKVVITGTHPEYCTGHMLEALQKYLNLGGRLMYMGGNGFYWVTSIDPHRPHIAEIRRWGGTQPWTSEPGEYYHSSTGELGGLWRYRNRAPQKMFGVGFTAQGNGPNKAYRRLPGSFDPRAAFIFDGIGRDELIGDFDCLDQGPRAAGFEFDRFDLGLGTPKHALLLASATGFSDSYQLAIEEVHVSDSRQGGTVNSQVRADMAYLEYPNGGAVFSTGSVTWSGCLSFNGYENNVSRITENVLRRFSKRAIPS